MLITKTDKILALYYGILLIILFVHGAAALPSLPIRVLFLAVLVFPLFFVSIRYTTLIVILFSLIAMNGANNTYLPYRGIMYLPIFLILAMSHKINILDNFKKIPVYLWLIVILTSAVNAFNSLRVEEISASFLILIVLLCIVEYDEDDSIRIVLSAFSLSALYLSLFYLKYQKQFAIELEDLDFDKSGWMDRNYYSTVLGMGAISSILMLKEIRNCDFFIKSFFAIVFALSLVVMVLVASRGGLLALGGAVLFYSLMGKFPIKFKIVGLLALVSLVYAIYRLGYFDYLEYRMMEEESLSDGSGRTNIWMMKIGHFGNELNLSQQVFGIGFQKGILLGSTYGIGFHNDFIAFLVEYGAIGLILWLIMLMKPIFVSSIKRRETMVLIIYLIFCSLTLEPFSGGFLSYFYCYIPILLFSRMEQPD